MKFFLFFLFLPVLGFSYNEIYVDKSGYMCNNNPNFNQCINIINFNDTGNLKYAWIKYEYNEDNNYKQIIAKNVYNCATGESANVENILYENSKLVDFKSTPPYYWNFQSMPPGSSGEWFQNFVCRGDLEAANKKYMNDFKDS